MTIPNSLLWGITFPLVYLIYRLLWISTTTTPTSSSGIKNPKPTNEGDFEALPSVLIPSYTSHARLLPIPTKHAFSYPLLYLGVDVDSLESGYLDIGRTVGYNCNTPKPRWTVLGLRPWNYLCPGPGSLREKVEILLKERGVDEKVGRIWMVSMPSILGFEGINPLTVWYIYKERKVAGGEARGLMCVILEVHNTFGEKHAYVLTTTSPTSIPPNPGYHHAWVFPRTFHVSPFNSRNGYYRLDILDPFAVHNTTDIHTPQTPLGPQMKVFLRLLTPEKQCKLTALVASHPTYNSIPLTSDHSSAILRAIVRWPLALFMSTPRILYQACVLHYTKRLAMYPRPEPAGVSSSGAWNPPQGGSGDTGVGIGWQELSASEVCLQRLVTAWAKNRAEETGISFEIRFNGRREDIVIVPGDQKTSSSLVIFTSDPSFFTNLLMAPSPVHYLCLAAEYLTNVSEVDLLLRFFTPHKDSDPHDSVQRLDKLDKMVVRVKESYFKWCLSHSSIPPPPDIYTQPTTPFLVSLSFSEKLWVLYIAKMAFFASWAEERIMYLINARYIPGSEPWKIWERALERQYTDVVSMRDKVEGCKDENGVNKHDVSPNGSGSGWGSGSEEGWQDLGSVQY